MEYAEFKFKNFKGIGDMALPLTGGVTTLIGLNESGKTTILEAIFCFSYGAENLDVLDPNMASLRDPERWIPISKRGNFNDSIEISATVTLSTLDKTRIRNHMRSTFGLRLTSVPDSIRVTEVYRFENSRFVNSSKNWNLTIRGTVGQQRNPRPYNAKTPQWQGAVAFLKEQLPSIWYFPNFLFELPDRFLLEESDDSLSREEQDKNKFYRSTFEQILDSIGTGANLNTHVVERIKSNDRADHRNLKSLMLEMSRSVGTIVFDGWNRIFGRRPISQDVDLDAVRGDDGHAYLELKLKGPDGFYDLTERSLGFRWFFMFLLMTSFRGGAEGERDVVFLLDEPASNLHSSAQAELLKSFESLAKSCHLIYTTHSHHMINVAWLDSAYVVKNSALSDDFTEYMSERTATATAISATPYRRFVAENPTQTSYFQPVLDILQYRPSFVEPIPDVVLVEGKSDYFILKYFVDVLGVNTDLTFVPGLGAGSLDTLVSLHLGWGKSFIVLLDGDAEGKRQEKRYREKFGELVGERCILLPDASGDAKAVEAERLIEGSDQTLMIDAVYPDASGRPARKKALQQAVMELLARREAVEVSPASLQRVEQVFDRLTAELGRQNS